MAKIGANHPCYKKAGESSGVVLGKLVTANITPNYSNAELFADDHLAESDNSFINAAIAVETDDLTAQNFALLYGATLSGDTVTSSINDTSPEGVFAFYKRGIKAGIPYFEGMCYPRTKAVRGTENSTTKGSTTNFQTSGFSLTAMAADDGTWEIREKFSTETEARAWVEEKTAVPATPSAALSSLSLGSLTLTPSFNAATFTYTTTTANATNTINAAAADGAATVSIDVGGTAVANGSPATWTEGANTVTITVTNGGTSQIYTVTVTKS